MAEPIDHAANSADQRSHADRVIQTARPAGASAAKSEIDWGQPPGKDPIYWLCWSICWVFLTLFYRLRVHHAERVPRTGPCLIIANHQSLLDPPMVGMAVRNRPSHFIARLGLFKNPMFGSLIRDLNSIPIREESGDVAAMKAGLARLGKGVVLIVFPEGTRSPDGEMRPFKRGVSLLVKRAACPVVPAGLEGCHHAWPRGQKLPSLFGNRVALCVGHPIAHDELMKDGPDAAMRRLEREVSALQLEARASLAASSRGRFPRRSLPRATA